MADLRTRLCYLLSEEQTPLHALAVSRSDIQQVKALRLKKERTQCGLFLAEGVKVVSELVASPLSVEAVFSTDSGFLHGLEGGFRKETVSARELERMSALSSPNTALAVARMPIPAQVAFDTELLLALDDIRDPGNLGTIIRTASWFGLRQIVCSPRCVDAFSPKVVQGAMGALFHTSVVYQELPEMLLRAKEAGYRAVTATLHGDTVYGASLEGRHVLVIGSESHGVSAEVLGLCDGQLRIPSFGESAHVESLNAAVATAVLLSEFKRRERGL